MEFIISFLQGSLSYVVSLVVLLGLLIFVHEMGHFLVAKYYKVRVEVFSLGFGPKLLKFKRGDTVYAISAIPLGGYVKMFGDDPSAEVSSHEKQYSFIHKPVGQRIAVVLAGPLMNFFFAIILFAGVANLGEQVLAPQLGDIATSSPAYAAGFRSGDTILSITDPSEKASSVKTFDEFQKAIEANADRALQVAVERSGSKLTETLQVTPKLTRNKNVMSWSREVGAIDGLTYSSRAAVVGVKDPESAAGKAGIKTGDIVQSINGTKFSRWREFTEELKRAVDGPNELLTLEVERGLLEDDSESSKSPALHNVSLSIRVPPEAKGQPSDKVLEAIGLEFPELVLAGIEKQSPAAAGGLQKGDRLLSIDGQSVQTFEQVASTIRNFGQTAGNPQSPQPATLKVGVLRAGKPLELTVAPNMKERMNPMGREEKRFEIGIRPLILDDQPATIEIAYANPIAALERGVALTWQWTSMTVLSFVRLFQAEVSPKNIGGFLSIAKMANQSWQLGLTHFLRMMAIISINLFVLNLLPVPVLDGGHLVFYSIEAARGAPLSMRKMEIAQQVGLVLLLGLMVFALFNDFTRIFN